MMTEGNVKTLLDAKPSGVAQLRRWLRDCRLAREACLAEGKTDWSFSRWWSGYHGA